MDLRRRLHYHEWFEAEDIAMYADKTLTPKEAVRLCALGTLAAGPQRYGALANAIRHFISHITGPSLDIMVTSVELLKVEGLIEAVDSEGPDDDALLGITEDGKAELKKLLTANIRAQASEMNKLIEALKFRFLHLLDTDDQRLQADILIEAAENELARLCDLRQYHAGDGGHLVVWLDHDIAAIEQHLAWLNGFRVTLD